MKKNLLTIIAALLLAVPALNAQSFGLGVSLGSEGAGLQVSAGITPSIVVRAGYTYFPYSFLIGKQDVNFQSWDVHPSGSTTIEEQKIQGSGNVLFDFYFTEGSPFHVTAGAMFGGGKMFQVTNTKAMPDSYHNSGMKYYPEGTGSTTSLHADANGIYLAELRRNAVRPYVGIGFGNPIGKSSGFVFDIGVQYTGGIGFYTDPSASSNDNMDFRLDSEGVQRLAYDMRGSQTKKGYDKFFKVIDTIHDIPLMPVVRFTVFFGI